MLYRQSVLPEPSYFLTIFHVLGFIMIYHGTLFQVFGLALQNNVFVENKFESCHNYMLY